MGDGIDGHGVLPLGSNSLNVVLRNYMSNFAENKWNLASNRLLRWKEHECMASARAAWFHHHAVAEILPHGSVLTPTGLLLCLD
jgi:hypothetical protein